jgi:glycosyltransferase involved in cell wall biosynthesis
MSEKHLGVERENTASESRGTVRELISVIVTVRNGERFVAEAIQSLLAQSDPSFEIVVVDDGSTDRTREILESFADSRLRIIPSPPIGRAEALASAVAASRGELIAILDADDIAMPDRLAKQRRYLADHPELALVGSMAVDLGADPSVVRPMVTGTTEVRRALGMYNPFYHSSILFRRSAYDAVGGYRPDGGWGHDKDLIIRIAARYPVDIMPERLIQYRHHDWQISIEPELESMRRRKAAALQLRAARALGLPPRDWIFPMMGWLYAQLPSPLRPRGLKAPVKRLLWALLRIGRRAPDSR